MLSSGWRVRQRIGESSHRFWVIPEDRSALVEWAYILREDVEGSSRVRRSDVLEPEDLIWLFHFSEELGLRSMWEFISEIDDFVVDALFYFKPIQRFENRSDVFCCRVAVTAWAREFLQ